MADIGVPITAGVGTPIAVEQAAGIDYQAIVFGARRTSLFTEVLVNFSAASQDLVALVALKVVKVYGLFLMAQGATDLTLKDGTTPTDLFPVVSLLGKGASWMLPRDGHPWCVTASSAKLTLTNSTSVQVTGRVYVIQE